MQERTVSHYRIIECLGGGAMGKVYRAEDTLLHRPVALKFLPAHLTEDDEASRRFMREARATSSLDHPNICTTHEIAQAEDGSWYIAMAWCGRRTLKQLMNDGPVPPHLALEFTRQTALGLSQAHDHDVIHRDIKPANLIITDQDDVKILDFGLARLVGKARLTRSGTVMGTAAYMSPEQARGEDAGPASDIWSLGVVLYEMLTGRSPFNGESDVAIIYSVLNVDPKPLPLPVCKNSEICTAVIHKCLARNPKDRFPSARALADYILVATEGSGAHLESNLSGSSAFITSKRRRSRGILLLFVALTLMAAVGLPQTRNLLESINPFTSGVSKTGVAIVPFSFSENGDEATTFGKGLSTTINDRLSELEHGSGRFWVVPTTEISRRKILDENAARVSQGVDLTVTGHGTFNGNTIDLKVIVYDNRDQSHTTREFKDSVGNLKTWQNDILIWLASVIDPEMKTIPDRYFAGHHTNIPASFLSYQHGLGHLASEVDDSGANAAVSFLERAVASDSSYSCAWTQLGRATWLKYGISDSARVAEARTYLLAGARLDSTSVWPHYYLARLLTLEGRLDEGLVELRRALDFDPIHAPTMTLLSNLYLRKGDNREAQRIYYQAVKARPRYPRPYKDAGVFHYYLSEFDRAEENFRKMIELAPDDYLGYTLMGAVNFETDDFKNAEAMFLRSLDKKPNINAYENLGTLFYYDHRFVDSIAMCQKALEYDSNSYSTWRTIAEAYRFAPDHADSVRPAYEKAMKLLQVKLAQDPESLEYKADHASFSAILGSPDKAREILADLESDDSLLTPELMFSMASTYEEIGDRDRALDLLEAAVEDALSFKKVDHFPVLKNLRTDPRYIALRNRYGE